MSRPTKRAYPSVRPWQLLVLLLALLALPATTLSQPSSDPPSAGWVTLAIHTATELPGRDLENVAADGNSLRLGGDAAFEARDHPPFRFFGLLTSPVIPSKSPFGTIRVAFDGSSPPGTAISIEVRVESPDGRWSPWQEVETSGAVVTPRMRADAAQYRATLLAESADLSPSLREIRIEILPADPSIAVLGYQSMATHPTVRLYATREGLVGRVTANGHRIVERDRFVALPSKKALNLKEGHDYQVEVSYNGRTTTAPVWDVGPWNTKDNYWDSPREIFNELPRFTPQVNAAFFDNHNNGNDQYGRPVLYPAAIDLADGTFWDDLGMKSADWVDVTFLWVDAVAPPLVPMPTVVSKAGPIPQPIWSQPQPQPQPQPVPTAVPTPTPLPKTWYFAEGSTSKPFDTWLLLQNPDPVPANAKITYMLPNGGQKIGNYLLKPTSRTSIFLNQEVPNTEVSTLIESDRYILAERAMYFGTDGHDTTGIISPSPTWYFAEGSTTAPYETWILMQNPNTSPTTATLTFFKEDGSTITHKMLIPHVSRASLLVNQVVPDSPVGIRIEADKPIVAERAIYKEKGKAGSDTVGAAALSKTWYMAEGVTRGGFDTWLLMLNPNDVPAYAITTYMKDDGTTLLRQYLLQPRSRVSIHVNQEMPDARVAIMVDADVPIVAERSVYFPDGYGAHGSMASPTLDKVWWLPEGSTAKPFTTNILLGNPNKAPANITASFMKEDGAAVEKKYTMKPTSRLTLEMNGILPDSAFSTRIEADQPIVVERSMYFSDWKGGTNSMGIPGIPGKLR